MFDRIKNFFRGKVYCAGCFWYRGQSKGVKSACVHKSNMKITQRPDTWLKKGTNVHCMNEAFEINKHNDCSHFRPSFEKRGGVRG